MFSTTPQESELEPLTFDEVASGNAQMYHAADYYWQEASGLGIFTSVPFGMTCREINSWIRFGGGQKPWDEPAESFGLKCYYVEILALKWGAGSKRRSIAQMI